MHFMIWVVTGVANLYSAAASSAVVVVCVTKKIKNIVSVQHYKTAVVVV